ncbi:MAG: NB-ARC domain-containing protein [Bacteroidia bacterium]|nr:NB-ARC domain-containing protein [Bacteroidia bacterium]
MTTIYNRRDIGYTVISRFEETYRNYLIGKVTSRYPEFRIGIPQGIVQKVDAKSEILYWNNIEDFFENLDFPDLFEISIYENNFKTYFPSQLSKSELEQIMIALYGLRCKIAHVKGYFTSIDLDRLIELTKTVAKEIDVHNDLIDLIEIIERNPDSVAIKVPLDFTVDYLVTNGIINNLPTPDYEYEGGFVGRDEDIKEIIKLLQHEKFSVVTITGAGGVGKTSLALKVIQEMTQRPKSSKYDAIIWLSAKENKLSPFGIEDIEPTFRSFEDILDTIIEVLGFGMEINSEENSIESKETLANTLFELSKSILIIVDNLETVTDQRIINFIIEAPSKIKFLITSRKGLGQVERRYELKQLKEKEAIYLFRQLAKDKQLQSLVKIDDNTIRRYVNKVSNYPLAIKWVIGQVARGRDINKIIDSIDDASGDISKFCFEQIFGMLNSNSKQILFALCCFDEPPTPSVLSYVVDVGGQEFDDSIEELILVSLIIPEQFKNEVNEIGSRYAILPLTRGYIRQQLNMNDSLRNRIQLRIGEVEGTINATEQAKRAYRFSLQNLGATTEQEKIAAIFIQTAFQKYQASLYDEAIDNYKKAINVAPKFSSIYRNWGVMEAQERHSYEAEQLFQKASELNPTDPQIWLAWGNSKRRIGKMMEADEKYRKAYELSPADPIILNAYGQTRGRLFDFETSLRLLTDALNSKIIHTPKKHEILCRVNIAEALIGWSEYLFKDRSPVLSREKLELSLLEINRALKLDMNDPTIHGVLVKTQYKLGKYYNAIGDKILAMENFNNALLFEGFGFKANRYKIKSAIEKAKLLIRKSDSESIRELLTPLIEGNDQVYRKHPELLGEINSILEGLGNKSLMIEGRIVKVDIMRDFVLIVSNEHSEFRFIGSKKDFLPNVNSLSADMANKNVKFLPYIFVSNGKEKRVARSITLLR